MGRDVDFAMLQRFTIALPWFREDEAPAEWLFERLGGSLVLPMRVQAERKPLEWPWLTSRPRVETLGY